MDPRTSFVIPLLAAALVACADDAPGEASVVVATDPGVTTVHIARSRFGDPEISVAPGTAVRFVNDDPFAHTVTSRDDAPTAFDSGQLQQGDTFEVTFDTPGTYRYFCEIHPTMRAVVVIG